MSHAGLWTLITVRVSKNKVNAAKYHGVLIFKVLDDFKGEDLKLLKSFFRNASANSAFIRMIQMAFQPKCENINEKSQPHDFATIKMGGAA